MIAIAASNLRLGFTSRQYKADLLSRGLLEMARFGIRFGANPNTFWSRNGGFSTTCFSNHGRNLRVGRSWLQEKVKEISAAWRWWLKEFTQPEGFV
ncbi:MAG: hypothetical protein H6757_02425 [Candidatus Omnitrophica bacterium]|nr:hypothetical protein [Candidatus Omnitrophota bacterium]